MSKREPKLRLCKTVGALIKELEKLPPSARLTDPMRPIHYNLGDWAKEHGLEPVVGFEDE